LGFFRHALCGSSAPNAARPETQRCNAGLAVDHSAIVSDDFAAVIGLN
jgi:hypothetical protein